MDEIYKQTIVSEIVSQTKRFLLDAVDKIPGTVRAIAHLLKVEHPSNYMLFIEERNQSWSDERLIMQRM